jgi:hypothetical protein
MNDGVKILLERMQTHPEEFHGDFNKWVHIINEFEKFFNASERALINGALSNIRREEFTRVVMQELLREPTPVEIDPSTFTIKTAGRAMWGTTTLELQEAQEKQQRTKLILEREVAKMKLGGLK